MTESADFKIFGLFFTTFHILIVLSAEPETMNFLSFVTATLKTVEECHCKNTSATMTLQQYNLNNATSTMPQQEYSQMSFFSGPMPIGANRGGS